MEGVIFHRKDVANELKSRFVESRLHMDGQDRVPAELFVAHRRLQQELIGSIAVPHYAFLDPYTGDFLFRHNLATDPSAWEGDFLRIFAQLPKRPSMK